MQDIKNQWAIYSDKLNSLSLRERSIVFVTLLTIMVMLFWLLLVEPYLKNKELLNSQISNSQIQLLETETALTILTSAANLDPNVVLRKEIENLVVLSGNMDKEISEITNALISPSQMTELLEKLLQDQKKLKLLHLTNAPVEEIQLGNNEEGVSIYRHSFKMQIKGKYLDVVDYLDGVEGLRWKVYWQHMDFEITRYPKGVLNIELYTLSTNKELMGV